MFDKINKEMLVFYSIFATVVLYSIDLNLSFIDLFHFSIRIVKVKDK